MIDTLTIKNIHGLSVTLSPYGARIISIKASAGGQELEMHEYHEDLERYTKDRQSSGAFIGPFANRIAGASFTLNGTTHSFEPNEGNNLLHSGSLGWRTRTWALQSQTEDMVVFYIDDRDSNWPGKLECYVTYQVTADQSIIIQMECLGEDPSYINLTSHGYFNLDGTEDLSHHEFFINASLFTALDDEQIPTGQLQGVADTFLDHRVLKSLEGTRIDHNYVIHGNVGEMRLASTALSRLSGIKMHTYTTQPGLQVFTGSSRYFCMETQHFPDSMHHDGFNGTLITPPAGYKEQCVYRFEGLDQSVGFSGLGGFSLPRSA